MFVETVNGSTSQAVYVPNRAGASRRSRRPRGTPRPRLPTTDRLLRGAPYRAPIDDPQRVAERGAVHDPHLVGLGVLADPAQLTRDVASRVTVDPLADQEGAATAAAAFAFVRQTGDTSPQQGQLEVRRVAHSRSGNHEIHDLGFDGADTVPARNSTRPESG